MGSRGYVKRIIDAYERMFGEFPRTGVQAPMPPGTHPELDEGPECDENETRQYQSLIGMLQWAVTLGRIDIHMAVMTMSPFRASPLKAHLDRVKRIFAYLRSYKASSIRFKTEVPDYSSFKVEEHNWTRTYGDVTEELPSNMPQPLGKPVRISTFVDASLLFDFVTGKSATGVLHLVNKTPIEWYCKKQSTVETATYGSEFTAARVATEQIMDLRYTLRMLGVPIDGPAWMFGDNLSVVLSATIPSSTLKKRWNALAYHRVREAIAAKILHFVHINGNENPADVLTKHLDWRIRSYLLKPIITHYEAPLRGQGEGSNKIPGKQAPEFVKNPELSPKSSSMIHEGLKVKHAGSRSDRDSAETA